jgi:hypothetical protein
MNPIKPASANSLRAVQTIRSVLQDIAKGLPFHLTPEQADSLYFTANTALAFEHTPLLTLDVATVLLQYQVRQQENVKSLFLQQIEQCRSQEEVKAVLSAISN